VGVGVDYTGDFIKAVVVPSTDASTAGINFTGPGDRKDGAEVGGGVRR
jgi:hypothetical protein